MRQTSIVLDVPWTLRGVRIALAAATTANVELMREWRRIGRRIPHPYHAGIRYIRQPGNIGRGDKQERFRLFDAVLKRGGGDCDQLCCYLAAYLQVLGEHATAIPKWSPGVGMHVRVRRAGGRMEDPSRKLGMGKGRR